MADRLGHGRSLRLTGTFCFGHFGRDWLEVRMGSLEIKRWLRLWRGFWTTEGLSHLNPNAMRVKPTEPNSNTIREDVDRKRQVRKIIPRLVLRCEPPAAWQAPRTMGLTGRQFSIACKSLALLRRPVTEVCRSIDAKESSSRIHVEMYSRPRQRNRNKLDGRHPKNQSGWTPQPIQNHARSSCRW